MRSLGRLSIVILIKWGCLMSEKEELYGNIRIVFISVFVFFIFTTLLLTIKIVTLENINTKELAIDCVEFEGKQYE